MRYREVLTGRGTSEWKAFSLHQHGTIQLGRIARLVESDFEWSGLSQLTLKRRSH